MSVTILIIKTSSFQKLLSIVVMFAPCNKGRFFTSILSQKDYRINQMTDKKTIPVMVRLTPAQIAELERISSSKNLKPGNAAAIQYLINQSTVLN
ncbi:hypothetical protein M2354_000775 [Leclercia adecarboxylata]|uniref:hypothetical protein n=1 Tax=Leclercia adecarboxylata TaxID=83655 RepID=UPI002473A8AC|nr:hypothetical protein [Leclercia adecarboxylata]MDH6161120.1 hypothetical protein [Leclercia adecarboxylata]